MIKISVKWSVPLDRIMDNPWQTREAADLEYICELADDIGEKGLLQAPMGRIVDEHGEQQDIPSPMGDRASGDIAIGALEKPGLFVQIAFGHNRKAAFDQLVHNLGDEYQTMPVEIRTISNEEMADFAWAENERRRDVTPMERAKAIQQRMEDFGWTQEQAAEHVGMSRPAVANVLRLLRLPEDLQGSVQEGEISERQAMALLPMVELPEEVIKRADDGYYGKPSIIIRDAKKGMSSNDIREIVEGVFARNMKDLEYANWPLDHVFSIENVYVPACDECDKRIQRGKETYCSLEACYELKDASWKELQLAEAVQALGIPALKADVVSPEYRSGFEGFGRRILQQGCENLRLHIGRYRGIDLDEEGFLEASAVCLHGEGGKCTCLAELKADFKRNDPGEKSKRERVQKKNQVFQAGTQILADALAEHEQGAWLLVLRKVDYNWRDKGEELSIEQIWQKIAHKVLKEDFWGDAPGPAQAHVRRRLESVGLGVEDEERSDVEDIVLRWERIQGWMKKLVKEIPTIEAVQGNLDNLDQLDQDARKFDPPVDEDEASKLDILYEDNALDGAIARLQELEILLHSAEWSEDRFEDVSWLVTVPPGDGNFKGRLKKAPAHILAYALTLVSGTEGNGTRAGVIRGRLNAITREAPVR